MRRSLPCFHLAVIAAALAVSAGDRANAANAPRFSFKPGDRVVLLGATTIERAQAFGHLETELVRRNPEKNLVFRNLGWSGDTVWAESRGIFDAPAKGYERMLAHVERLKPTVIVVAYGGNEAFAGPAGLDRFTAQFNKLLDDLSPRKARFVLVSPHHVPHLPPGQPNMNEHNRHLELYANAIEQIAQQRGATYVSMLEPRIPLPDGSMHLDNAGNRIYARHFADRLLGPTGVPFHIIADDAANTRESKLTLKMERLPSTTRPDISHVVKLAGLPDGRYSLRAGDREIASGTAKQWHAGIKLNLGRDARQAETLRQTIIKKNEFYFHRWRPQNITYLFLFRKHEQGQNAREVPEFDKFVAAEEAKIAQLATPKQRTYRLVRVQESK